MGYIPYGGARAPYRVWPIKEFVQPVEEVEHLWCKNEKAIEMITAWPTFHQFFNEWKQVSGNKNATISIHDKDALKSFWLRASKWVEALRRIDKLRDDEKWGWMGRKELLGDNWFQQRAQNERSIRNLRRCCMR